MADEEWIDVTAVGDVWERRIGLWTGQAQYRELRLEAPSGRPYGVGEWVNGDPPRKDTRPMRDLSGPEWAAFRDADVAWFREIARVFPKNPDAAYLPAGRGAEGTELRRLFEARQAAIKAWEDTSFGTLK